VTRYAFLLGLAPFAILFALAFLFPVGQLVVTGLLDSTPQPSLAEGYLTRVVLFTYGQALLSTLLAFALGALGAFLLFENRSRRLPALSRLSLVCFSLPSLVVVLALLAVWGRSGWWNSAFPSLAVDVYGVKGIVLANAFFNFPLFLLSLGTGLRGLDRQWEQTSLAFGAGRLRTFVSITLPRLWPDLRGAAVVTFLYSSATSFVVALFLGGGPRATTLEVAVYQAMKMDYNPALAARLALVSLAVSLLLYFVFLRRDWFTSGQESLSEQVVPVYAPRGAGTRIALWAIFLAGLGAMVLLPLLALVAEGIAAVPALEFPAWFLSMRQSLQLSVLAALVAVPTGLAFAYAERLVSARWAKLLLGFLPSLPLAASSLLLSVGLLLTYPEWMAAGRGSLLPIAIVQALGALPLVHRTIREGLFRIPVSLVRTAQSFGATPFQVFAKVELPGMARSLQLAALIAMASSLGEVAAVLLFSPGEVSTLSVELFRAVGRYKFQEGFGYAVVLIGLLSLLTMVSGRKRVARR